jgi:hypothetical protein
MQIVCAECGRAIDSDYIHCPWCGTNRLGGSAWQGRDFHFKRIARMARTLDALEKDLSALALIEEMRK